jgi:hypothetical protein
LGGQAGEVAIDGGPGDTELGGDLGDGVRSLPVKAALLVHLLRDLCLQGVNLGFCPPVVMSSSGRRASSPDALSTDLLEKRSECLANVAPDNSSTCWRTICGECLVNTDSGTPYGATANSAQQPTGALGVACDGDHLGYSGQQKRASHAGNW